MTFLKALKVNSTTSETVSPKILARTRNFMQPCESRSAFGIADLKADLLTLEVSSSVPTILYHMVGMTQLARSAR